MACLYMWPCMSDAKANFIPHLDESGTYVRLPVYIALVADMLRKLSAM